MYVALTDHQGHEAKHYVHRLLMEAFNPRSDMGHLDVNHKDGNKQNNVLTNLEWLNHQQNIMHARIVLNAWAENQPRGEGTGNAKLTEDNVREIRRLASSGKHQIDIAPLFGVSHVSIGNVIRGKTWAHVD